MRPLLIVFLLFASSCTATTEPAPTANVPRSKVPGPVSSERAVAFSRPLVASAPTDISGEREMELCKEHVQAGAPYEFKPHAVILCEVSQDGRQALFLVAFNAETRTPDWVAYRITRERMLAVDRTPAKRKSTFSTHPRLKETDARSPAHKDYTGSGYDRGHLAPSRAMQWHPEAWAASYRTTNIAPQFPSMNQNVWRCLEHSVQQWAKGKGDIYVVTGVLHSPSKGTLTSNNTIRIPSHYYTVVYSPHNGGQSIAFLAENRQLSDDPRDIAKSIDQIEAFAKLDFFKLVPKQIQDAAERKQPDFAEWPIWVPAGRNCVPACPRTASLQ